MALYSGRPPSQPPRQPDVNMTTTSKRRSSNVSKENKNNKRRRSVTTKARALEPNKTTKRHASHVSKQNKNNKRRRSVTTKAPALKPSTGAGGSCTHCLTIQKLMEKQTKQLSHVVKELAAVRQHVKDQAQEVTNASAGLRAFVTLELGTIRTKLDMHTNLLNRVLTRGQKHTRIMQILCEKLPT